MPTTRTLTNAGAPLHSPEGDLLGGVQIHFQLMDMGGRPSDAWDAISNERVGGETVIVTTDAAGEFSVDLWPNTRGNRETKYKCRVQFEGFREFSGVIEDVPGELQWAAFMLAGSSMEPQDMSAIAAAITSHINAADPHPQYTTAAEAAAAAPVQSVAGRTGAVTLAKADVGLSNVDNTSDANKPVSTAQQTALNLKANLASPTFTGTVGGITKSMVGLGNVDNTADSAKPVSTAQAAAIATATAIHPFLLIGA